MEESISRSDLRAELAELKLSLLTDLRVELDRKASRESVDQVVLKVGAHDARIATLERHKSETQKVAEAVVADEKRRWSKREKLFLVAGIVFAFLSLLLSALALGPDIINSWSGP